MYDALDVKLTEVGESFYNPYIPSNIAKLQVATHPINPSYSCSILIHPINPSYQHTLSTCQLTLSTHPIVNPQSAGMVEEDEGMLIIRLPGFDIPLIVRKSDGGFGYDSTDMAGECPLSLLTLESTSSK